MKGDEDVGGSQGGGGDIPSEKHSTPKVVWIVLGVIVLAVLAVLVG